MNLKPQREEEIEKILERFNEKFPTRIYDTEDDRGNNTGEKVTAFKDIGINPGKIKAFLRKELSSLIGEKRRDKEHWLKFFREDIKNCFMPKCGWCGKIATTQTVRGKNAQENNNRPLNWGYYCKSCYAKGLKEEEEAMYG